MNVLAMSRFTRVAAGCGSSRIDYRGGAVFSSLVKREVFPFDRARRHRSIPTSGPAGLVQAFRARKANGGQGRQLTIGRVAPWPPLASWPLHQPLSLEESSRRRRSRKINRVLTLMTSRIFRLQIGWDGSAESGRAGGVHGVRFTAMKPAHFDN